MTMPTDDLFADALFIDPNKDYLVELVGEGKKFSTPQELARGKAEADAHVTRLEDEQRRLREELATRIKYEEFLDKLNTSPPSNPPAPQGEPPAKDTSVKPEEIERLLEQKLNQRESQKTAEQNLTLVVNKLQEVLGPNYAQHLKKQTTELGMTEQAVRNLAASNPKVLFKLLGIGEKPQDNLFMSPPRSQMTFTPTGGSSGKRGFSYYEEIRKKDNSLYWSPKIQNEMFNACKEMGIDDFNNS
jgi:hypothetical protein